MADLPDARARYETALAEIAEMKRTLAERARNVAELEARLMRQVEEGAGRVATRAVGRRREPAAEPTESDLARAVAAAEAEKALAAAEREQLEVRERNIRQVERELAGLRVQLEKEWRRLKGSAAPPPALGEPKKPAASQPARQGSTERR